MALGGIFIFGERYRAAQWFGLLVIAAGLLLFFSDQIAAAANGGAYARGGREHVFVARRRFAHAFFPEALPSRLHRLEPTTTATAPT
jgi:hypothetical protein